MDRKQGEVLKAPLLASPISSTSNSSSYATFDFNNSTGMRLVVDNPNDIPLESPRRTPNDVLSLMKLPTTHQQQASHSEISEVSTTTISTSSTVITLSPNEELIIREPRKKIHFPSLFVWPALWHVIVFCLVALLLILGSTVAADWLESLGISTEKFLLFASIPIVSVAFTYCHIWLALWMTFYPIKFFGLWQLPGTNTGLGWQGIIPFKAEKMARMSVRLMTAELFNVKDLFARLDPDRVAVEMGHVLKDQLHSVIDGVARKYHPDVWAVLPERVKNEIVNTAHEDAPQVIADLMRNIKDNIETVFDVEHMVVTNLLKDVGLLCDIFIRCGYNELVFIRNSGAYMGGIFGFIQMLIWIPLHSVGTSTQLMWFLPTYGFIVGLATNWLALKMIFQPVEPRRICGVLCHGLFLRRQKEVAAEYGRTIAADVLNSKNIIQALVAGPTTDKLFAIVHQVVKKAIDEFSGLNQPLMKASIHVTLGQAKYDQVKSDICDKMVEIIPTTLSTLEIYTERALDMENTLREKMSELSYSKFERLLHPVFEEDEWKLVLMGGVLGIVIGFAQHFAGI